MVLGFYDRPGGAPSNNWVCPTCVNERTNATLDAIIAEIATQSPIIPLAEVATQGYKVIRVDEAREVEPTHHQPVLEVQKDDMPTAAETLVWKAELNKYTSTTTGSLIKAGMTAGPIGRVRAYAIKTFGVQPDSTGKLPLTNSQWHTLLEATFKRGDLDDAE